MAVGQNQFIQDVFCNPKNRALLERLPALKVPDVWLVAGSLFQTVWNVKSGRPPEENISDYDLFYFNPDTSFEAEDREIKRVTEAFKDLGVEVQLRNQARVPLWYKEKFGNEYLPVHQSKDSIGRFLIECTCVGLRPEANGKIEMCAPFGLDDLYAGILKTNRNHFSEKSLPRKKAESYQKRWPWLQYKDIEQ
jgi:uncharacterized protein